MGTSRNDPSFGVSEWSPANAVVGRQGAPVDLQLVAIWRAASAAREGRLEEELGSPLIAHACRLVSEGVEVHNGVERYLDSVVENRLSGLFVEVGKRALVSVLGRQGNEGDFAAEVFSRAVSYYVARDLPSFVAAEGRVQNVEEAIGLKSELVAMTRARVESVDPPVSSAAEAWRSYVGNVMATLATREGSP